MIPPEVITNVLQGQNDELVRLDRENKELKKENKELKKENKELKAKIESMEIVMSDLEARAGNLSNSLSYLGGELWRK